MTSPLEVKQQQLVAKQLQSKKGPVISAVLSQLSNLLVEFAPEGKAGREENFTEHFPVLVEHFPECVVSLLKVAAKDLWCQAGTSALCILLDLASHLPKCLHRSLSVDQAGQLIQLVSVLYASGVGSQSEDVQSSMFISVYCFLSTDHEPVSLKACDVFFKQLVPTATAARHKKVHESALDVANTVVNHLHEKLKAIGNAVTDDMFREWLRHASVIAGWGLYRNAYSLLLAHQAQQQQAAAVLAAQPPPLQQQQQQQRHHESQGSEVAILAAPGSNSILDTGLQQHSTGATLSSTADSHTRTAHVAGSSSAAAASSGTSAAGESIANTADKGVDANAASSDSSTSTAAGSSDTSTAAGSSGTSTGIGIKAPLPPDSFRSPTVGAYLREHYKLFITLQRCKHLASAEQKAQLQLALDGLLALLDSQELMLLQPAMSNSWSALGSYTAMQAYALLRNAWLPLKICCMDACGFGTATAGKNNAEVLVRFLSGDAPESFQDKFPAQVSYGALLNRWLRMLKNTSTGIPCMLATKEGIRALLRAGFLKGLRLGLQLSLNPLSLGNLASLTCILQWYAKEFPAVAVAIAAEQVVLRRQHDQALRAKEQLLAGQHVAADRQGNAGSEEVGTVPELAATVEQQTSTTSGQELAGIASEEEGLIDVLRRLLDNLAEAAIPSGSSWESKLEEQEEEKKAMDLTHKAMLLDALAVLVPILEQRCMVLQQHQAGHAHSASIVAAQQAARAPAVCTARALITSVVAPVQPEAAASGPDVTEASVPAQAKLASASLQHTVSSSAGSGVAAVAAPMAAAVPPAAATAAAAAAAAATTVAAAGGGGLHAQQPVGVAVSPAAELSGGQLPGASQAAAVAAAVADVGTSGVQLAHVLSPSTSATAASEGAVAAGTSAAQLPPAAGASESSPATSCAQCGAMSGVPGVVLRRCRGCAYLRYCSETCQRVHWREGGHYKLCKQMAAAAAAGKQ